MFGMVLLSMKANPTRIAHSAIIPKKMGSIVFLAHEKRFTALGGWVTSVSESKPQKGREITIALKCAQLNI